MTRLCVSSVLAHFWEYAVMFKEEEEFSSTVEHANCTPPWWL